MVCFIHLLNNVIPCIYNYYTLLLDKTFMTKQLHCNIEIAYKKRGVIRCVCMNICVCECV